MKYFSPQCCLLPGFPPACGGLKMLQTQLILGLFPTPLSQTLCQEAPRLCPHLNQQLKSHNPLNSSRPAFHTYPAWRGTKSQLQHLCPCPGGLIKPAAQPWQAAGGAGLAWQLVFLNEDGDAASLTPKPELGVAAVVGSCLRGQLVTLSCCHRGEWLCRGWGWDINREIESCCLSCKSNFLSAQAHLLQQLLP